MGTARYKAFLAAVETGSFAAAAKQMDYTVSGVSQLVAALEKELGFPLLLRSRHGVTLSPNGERLLVPIRQLLTEEKRMEELASDIRGLLTGSLNIAAYSSVATHWLPPVIGRFQKDYPQIKIHLMEGIRQEVTAWLDKGTADIGFLSYQEPMPYDWIPLSDDEMVAAVPPDHELAPDGPYPLARCQEETVIMPALGKDDDVLQLLKKNNLQPRIGYTTLENSAAISMVEEGLGISIMNRLITRKRVTSAVLLPLDPPASITLGIAFLPGNAASPTVRKFAQYALAITTHRPITE